MIGASKLKQEDIDQIRSLFKQGLSDSEIAAAYNVSRIHINHIRNGKKWNPSKHSFIMKDQLKKDKVSNNHIIVRLVEDNICLKTFTLGIDDLVTFSPYITQAYENQGGGWTIYVDVQI